MWIIILLELLSRLEIIKCLAQCQSLSRKTVAITVVSTAILVVVIVNYQKILVNILLYYC